MCVLIFLGNCAFMWRLITHGMKATDNDFDVQHYRMFSSDRTEAVSLPYTCALNKWNTEDVHEAGCDIQSGTRWHEWYGGENTPCQQDKLLLLVAESYSQLCKPLIYLWDEKKKQQKTEFLNHLKWPFWRVWCKSGSLRLATKIMAYYSHWSSNFQAVQGFDKAASKAISTAAHVHYIQWPAWHREVLRREFSRKFLTIKYVVYLVQRDQCALLAAEEWKGNLRPRVNSVEWERRRESGEQWGERNTELNKYS